MEQLLRFLYKKSWRSICLIDSQRLANQAAISSHFFQKHGMTSEFHDGSVYFTEVPKGVRESIEREQERRKAQAEREAYWAREQAKLEKKRAAAAFREREEKRRGEQRKWQKREKKRRSLRKLLDLLHSEEELREPEPSPSKRKLLYPTIYAVEDFKEHRLAAYVLWFSVREVLAPANTYREKDHRSAAVRWLKNNDICWPLSFLRICESCDIDPGYVRRKVAEETGLKFNRTTDAKGSPPSRDGHVSQRGHDSTEPGFTWNTMYRLGWHLHFGGNHLMKRSPGSYSFERVAEKLERDWI